MNYLHKVFWFPEKGRETHQPYGIYLFIRKRKHKPFHIYLQKYPDIKIQFSMYVKWNHKSIKHEEVHAKEGVHTSICQSCSVLHS